MAQLPWVQGRGLQEAVSGAKSNRWHSPCCWLPFLIMAARNLYSALAKTQQLHPQERVLRAATGQGRNKNAECGLEENVHRRKRRGFRRRDADGSEREPGNSHKQLG